MDDPYNCKCFCFSDHALQCVYDDVINDIQIVPVGISYQGAPLEKWPQNFLQYIKGQLISKGVFKVFICTKKQTKIYFYFCPSL